MTAEMDKAVKAAQKAATDEMKKSVRSVSPPSWPSSLSVGTLLIIASVCLLQAKEQVAFNVAGHLNDFSKSVRPSPSPSLVSPCERSLTVLVILSSPERSRR